MFKLITVTLVAWLLTGCVNTHAPHPPTHRWASTEDADKARYALDHSRCQAETNVAADGRELDGTSAAFTAYKQCMNNRGYVLTAYNQ